MKKAIIIGAGPAGLTAAYEFLKRTNVQPVILEKSGDIGGISKTLEYKGNRLDIGPHRLFSKSDKVMDWWLNIIPLEDSGSVDIQYQNQSRSVPDNHQPTAKDPEKAMLVVKRLSRIYFLRRFFFYPLQLSFETLKIVGLPRTISIISSYIRCKLSPIRPEVTLEDFMINRFGRKLYHLFFQAYTEKIWGVPCSAISAEWGAARIKGVSLQKVLLEALKAVFNKKKDLSDIGQKDKEVSLLEQFLYPRRGPGSLWEEVARQIREMGGEILLHQDVQVIHANGSKILSIQSTNSQTGEVTTWQGDYFFSSMPVKELIAGLDSQIPNNVREVAAGLQYRDFINVGVLLKQLSAKNKNGTYDRLELKDTWLYINEGDVKVGRIMIYNNWGDGMIKDPNNTWIGMEYFCYITEPFWALSDSAIEQQAINELEKIGLARREDVLDITVRRMEKTYPAYFGTYDRFEEVKTYIDRFENLYLVGRNGMHKYNNSDHSMLTAMAAVDNIAAGIVSQDNIWNISTGQEYGDQKE